MERGAEEEVGPTWSRRASMYNVPLNVTKTENMTVAQKVTLLNSTSTSSTNEAVGEKKLLAGRYEYITTHKNITNEDPKTRQY